MVTKSTNKMSHVQRSHNYVICK